MCRIYGASSDAGTHSTGIPTSNERHTLVGKIDYANEEIRMWINPDLSSDESANPADLTHPYTSGEPSTTTRLGSGGSGPVTWDHLVVAREWSALGKFPWVEAAPVALRITTTSFDDATRTFSLSWESDPAATYTLWESSDLSADSWTEVDIAIPGDAGASTTYPVPGIPAGRAGQFYRVTRNP